MCGFVGSVVPKTGHALRHRGPDGHGSLHAGLPWAHVTLEMSRLAVVDRRQIGVPFDFRTSSGVVLAYNGELYNHNELRVELSDGVAWETGCDAEVVARAWRRWGPRMLERMNGMWGMALVDVVKGEVFLARDRAGEKPLYYAPFGTGVAFASEVKALPVRLEEAPCSDVDVFEFDCLEETPFRGVRRLGPGKYVHLKSPVDIGRFEVVTWWERTSVLVDHSMTFNDAVEECQSLIVDAIKIRAVSEVKVGVQVSGGLDSAIVQAVARSENCYTVTFPDDGVDNLRLAKIAAGRKPTAVTFGLSDLERDLPSIAWHLDTPATWTAVAQWFMGKRMSEDGCVVVLSGEGADELFGGYSRYRLLHWLERARVDERLRGYDFVRERLHGTDNVVLARLLNRSGDYAYARALEIVERFWDKSRIAGLVEDAMRVDFYTTMQVLLRMADRMAAAFSMENRSIFFDYRLMELADRMPVEFKVTDDESKAVLLEVARRIGVPEDVVSEKTKRGLFIPWSRWTGSSSWDRGSFAERMRSAWRSVFFGEPDRWALV